MVNGEYIYKEDLLNEFLEDRQMITYLNGENDKVIDYYGKKYGYNSQGNKAYKDFIEENLYYLLNNDTSSFDEDKLNKWIKDIKDYEVFEYVDGLIDIYDDDLIQSYKYFQEWTDTYEINENNIDVMKSAQYEGYSILFNNIKYQFIDFLEGQLN